jgi:outer membrane biosynthesis protein TonB
MSSTISSDQKKSLLFSLLIYASLLLLLFFIRFWPPSNLEEFIGSGGGGGGVTLNFGDSELGAGKNIQSEVLDIKNEVIQTPSKSTPDEAILSQENAIEESVVIPQKEKTKEPVVDVKKEVKPEVVKPKISNSTNDALSNILKGSNKGGDGDDKTAGNKGKTNGSIGATGYAGDGGSGGGTGGGNGTGSGIGTGSGYGAGSGGGSGGGSGYSLGNRKAISKPKPNSNCSDEVGMVVVEVTVDKNGNTISAVPGIRGTTITAKCLKDEAKLAAMKTKWDASKDAPEKQIGKIIYNFNLN